jgi:hypothetical protein
MTESLRRSYIEDRLLCSVSDNKRRILYTGLGVDSRKQLALLELRRSKKRLNGGGVRWTSLW